MIDAAMYHHLRHNHYPPIPTAMARTAREAINAAQDGEWDREIALPDGVSVNGCWCLPARQVVEWLHLDGFLDEDDDL